MEYNGAAPSHKGNDGEIMLSAQALLSVVKQLQEHLADRLSATCKK